MNTLVIYVCHEINDNVTYFLEHGIFDDKDTHFIIVINNRTLQIPNSHPNVTILNRDNIGFDFGGWSYGLYHNNNLNKYDYYIFINSTVLGPLLPKWVFNLNPNFKWTNIYTSLLTDDIKLVGSTIAFFISKPHVQSMIMATDKIGLNIGIQSNIFEKDIKNYTKMNTIIHHEIKYSKRILESNFNIACLLPQYKGRDFRIKQSTDPITKNPYISPSDNYTPYQVVFVKNTNRPNEKHINIL